MLKRSEWSDIAERSAAASFGSHHWRKYAFRHHLPVYAGLALLAALGYGIWWAQDKVRAGWTAHSVNATAPTATPADRPGVPLIVWVAMAVLAVLTFVAFRPGRGADRLSVLLAKVLLLGASWLALLGLAFGLAF